MYGGWGLVKLDVICECKIGVGVAFLLSPEDCFSSLFSGNCLGLRDMEDDDLVAALILDAMLDISDLDMGLGIEAVKVLDCELA
jgi:hypothetical protein